MLPCFQLKHKLANAFDDLLDEDEASSVNSSGNFTLDAAQTNGGRCKPYQISRILAL